MERYRALAGIHVLVVDDNEDGRELIKHVLVHDDATVTTAQSGIEALETLKFTVPDVLVSGDHGAVAEWRRQQSDLRSRRPPTEPTEPEA